MSNDTLKKRFSDKCPGYSFKVRSVNSCPIYRVNDKFELRETLLYAPAGKPTCLPLSTDMIVNRKFLKESTSSEEISFTCDGCGEGSSITVDHFTTEKVPAKLEKMVGILQQISFFKLLRKDDIREMISELKITKCNAGDIIINKGEPGKALFVIVSGMVEILPDEDGESIITHGVGKVFGEMSLLSGGLCTATVRVTEPTQLLTMNPERFKNMIHHFPKLQKYFFQLLARRLDKTNMQTVRGGAQIQGTLTEWKLPDLLQTINMNTKSGTLELTLPYSSVEILFYRGQICRVVYGDLEGLEAFYKMFQINDAKFRFQPEEPAEGVEMTPIGDFMFLMVEGLVRTDEKKMLDDGITPDFPDGIYR